MAAILFGAATLQAQQLAFPGAEGFGRYATGGRTGSVYHVTNLNDDGPGSFRDAVSSPNRIVVFDVAGVIRINSRISVSPNLYIAGQTAPGEGVTIYGNSLSFSGADNTICRYLRVRMGVVEQKGADSIGIAHGKNMIFDHVSAAWGRDETFSISGKHPENITIQNSIISQGLINHSAGGLVQTENRVTIYRTLYANNNTRNPKFKGRHQYVNNIIYNWNAAAYIMGGNSQMTSYANIEHYINSIDHTYSQPFLKAPVALTAQPTGNQVTLTWIDFTDGEKNFVVEQRINGTFQEVKRTKANATQCTISDLAPATSHTFRVKATGKQGESEYSKAVEVKTR